MGVKRPKTSPIFGLKTSLSFLVSSLSSVMSNVFIDDRAGFLEDSLDCQQGRDCSPNGYKNAGNFEK